MTPATFRQIRHRLGYSQSQAAEAVGRSTRQIGRVEQTGDDPGRLAEALRRHEMLVEAGAEARIPERKAGRPRAA